MSIFASPRFLSRVMWADSASCAATGVVQLSFAALLAQKTGLPAALLTETGIFLIAYALAAAFMASRPQAPRTLIGLVMLGNVAWALACVGLIVSGQLPLTTLGQLWLAAQTAVVLVLADLQWAGLRRTAAPAHPYSGADIARHKMLKSSSN